METNDRKSAGQEKKGNEEQNQDEKFPGYPIYPANEDIYSQEKEEADLDPETLTKKPNPQKTQETSMDVPGSELDDDQEKVGSEDEENNYYSLGGDAHEDLEENRDEFDPS